LEVSSPWIFLEILRFYHVLFGILINFYFGRQNPKNLFLKKLLKRVKLNFSKLFYRPKVLNENARI
jgi:hypothetical protein